MASSELPRASAETIRPGTDLVSRQTKRTIWSGVLAGIGLAAFLDETIFHQLLHWHHFYDKSTLAAVEYGFRRAAHTRNPAAVSGIGQPRLPAALLGVTVVITATALLAAIGALTTR